MIDEIFFGGILRFCQTLLESAPTILVGLLITGVLRRLFGYSATRRMFGHGTWRALPQAWLIGMLLPVCSLGVIPLARELRKAGLSGGTILAFAMTAPLFNPLSLFYGLSLSDPLVIFLFALCSLLVVTLVGLSWDRIFPASNTLDEVVEPPPVDYGIRRMTAIGVVAAREMVGPSVVFMLIGILGSVFLNVALPFGSLQTTMEHDNQLAAIQMTVVAVPAYATPMLAMSQLGMMFQHGNSISAAFVLLTLGAGVNLGLIAWMFARCGVRPGLAWMAMLMAIVIGLAYALEDPLYPDDIEPSGHTHAFDIYCCPFAENTSDYYERISTTLEQKTDMTEVYGLGALGVIMLIGAGLSLLDRRWRIESWLESRDKPTEDGADRPRSKFDVIVPAPVLGGVLLLALIVTSVVACYAYYPPREQVLEEMQFLQAEVLMGSSSGSNSHALHYIPVWDDWTRRLQVGVYIREGHVSDYRRVKARIFREKLELLEHALEDEDRDEILQYASEVSLAYRRMAQAFRTPSYTPESSGS